MFLFVCCNCFCFICGDSTGGPGETKGCLFITVTSVEPFAVVDRVEVTFPTEVVDEVLDSLLELGTELRLGVTG